MKLLYAGYREWAKYAHNEFLNTFQDCHQVKLVMTQDELLKQLDEFRPDVTFLAGWSWIIPARACEQHYIVAFHPSDLPNYAGGTPIQHQILDGVTKTKATLFRVTPKLDAGGILMKVDLSLDGNMTDIFRNLKKATIDMLTQLVECWPNVNESPQAPLKPRKRLKPEDSKLTPQHLEQMSARQLYNFIRCREDPYPNVYVEDETGRLLIKLVDFETK